MEKKLTLLSPTTWDDTNDTYYLSQYKVRRSFKAVLALCFTQSSETYHHWRVFAPGVDGVCIEFNRAKTLSTLRETQGIRFGSVKYKKLAAIKKARPLIDELPFLKRYPFKDEKEFRIIFEDSQRALESKSIELDLSCIKRIVLSPWIAKPLADTLRTAIQSIDGAENISVDQTTLVDNEAWKRGATKFLIRKGAA